MLSNRQTGDAFHRLARSAFRRATGVDFDVDVPLPVGNPPRNHRFDFASPSRDIVGEAKCYSWTESDNAPSAKLGHLKEAVQFLQQLPASTKTFIVMKRHCRRRSGEALADYFVRLNAHLLGTTAIIELDETTSELRIVHGRMF